MSILSEIKRRKVFRVAAVYAVVGWLLIQIAISVEAPLRLPDWADTIVIMLVVLGFPLACTLAWIFDLTPEGVVRTEPLPENGAAPAPRAEDGRETHRGTLPNSVAVLPLENLSPNPDDAYFAAGIHEEILNYLAKIEDLNVIARTTVKQYAASEKPISQIASELGVGTVLEGSVRYAGQRVRVAAQLIDAANDNHLWSEIYERDLVDVFSIQADIAQKIAEALKTRLSPADKETLESLPSTQSPEAHALYLESQALIGQSDVLFVTSPASIRAAVQSKLARAVELDPNFAHPYALKALLYAISRIYDPVDEADWIGRAAELDRLVRENAEKAMALSPSLRVPHLAIALNHQFNWRPRQAQAAYEKALERGASDASVQHWYSGFKWVERDFEQALAAAQRSVTLDPVNILSHTFLGLIHHSAGDLAASLETFERALTMHPASPHLHLHCALPLVGLGREVDALERLWTADDLMPEAAAPAIHVHLAYGFGRLGRRDKAAAAVHKAKQRIGQCFIDPTVRTWVALAEGNEAEALEWLRVAAEQPELRHEFYQRGFVEENAWCDPVLDKPEFVELRRKLTLETTPTR